MDFRRIGGGRPGSGRGEQQLIRTANGKKNRLIDAANGAKGSPDYVAKVQAAQAAQLELEQLVARDPTAPLLQARRGASCFGWIF